MATNWMPPPPPGPPPGWVPYSPYSYGPPPWPGGRLGLPPQGRGSVAGRGERFAAWLLDFLFCLPFIIAGIVLSSTIRGGSGATSQVCTGTNYGVTQCSSSTFTAVWFVGVGIGDGVIFLCWLLYETLLTWRIGRTWGKAILHIRPQRVGNWDRPLTFGRSLGRAAAKVGLNLLPVVSLLDPLWCLWDKDRQCLHDKMADTVVVRDR